MDHYKRMVIFSKVVEQGSMSAAARLLRMTPSAVSQQIRYLENQSGITLLHRSTRKLTLTEVGERYYFYCQQLCEVAENAQNILELEKEEPLGELRIAAPIGLATYFLSNLGKWAQNFPFLSLNIQVHDEYIDLVEQRIDLAIRVGNMPDSSYLAYKISEMQMELYASPTWLEKYGLPTHPHELTKTQWLHFSSNKGSISQINFFQESNHLSITLEENPKLAVNNIMMLKQMCEEGYGVCIMSKFEVGDSVLKNKLVRILPDWHMGRVNIWAVVQKRSSHSAKVIQAIEHLRNDLKN